MSPNKAHPPTPTPISSRSALPTWSRPTHSASLGSVHNNVYSKWTAAPENRFPLSKEGLLNELQRRQIWDALDACAH